MNGKVYSVGRKGTNVDCKKCPERLNGLVYLLDGEGLLKFQLFRSSSLGLTEFLIT